MIRRFMGHMTSGVLGGYAARFSGGVASGNSVVTVTDAAGRLIARIDPWTRERTDLDGRPTETHAKLTPRDAFVGMLLRPRAKASIAELIPAQRKRGRPRKIR